MSGISRHRKCQRRFLGNGTVRASQIEGGCGVLPRLGGISKFGLPDRAIVLPKCRTLLVVRSQSGVNGALRQFTRPLYVAGIRLRIGLKSPPFVLEVRLAIKPRQLFCHPARVALKKIDFVELEMNAIVVQFFRDRFVQRLPGFIETIEDHQRI